MKYVKSVQEAIESLDARKSAGEMSADDAIMLAANRNGRPLEDDWELVEAAEVLAREVSDLRSQIEAAKHGL